MKYDPDKCPLEEAIERLKEETYDGNKKTIIKRFEFQMKIKEVMPLDEAIAYAKEVDYPPLWELVIKRGDLFPKEALRLAQEINHPKVWAFLEDREDVQRYL